MISSIWHSIYHDKRNLIEKIASAKLLIAPQRIFVRGKDDLLSNVEYYRTRRIDYQRYLWTSVQIYAPKLSGHFSNSMSLFWFPSLKTCKHSHSRHEYLLRALLKCPNSLVLASPELRHGLRPCFDCFCCYATLKPVTPSTTCSVASCLSSSFI